MTSIETQILKYITSSKDKLHSEINAPSLCKTLNITYEQMSDALESLVKQELLRKEKAGYIGSLTKEDVIIYKLV